LQTDVCSKRTIPVYGAPACTWVEQQSAIYFPECCAKTEATAAFRSLREFYFQVTHVNKGIVKGNAVNLLLETISSTKSLR